MKNLIFILLAVQSTVAFTATICETRLAPTGCGDGVVSITFPEGLDYQKIDEDQRNRPPIGYRAPIAIHNGDIHCWFTNFEASGDISRGWTPPYYNVVARKMNFDPEFQSVAIGSLSFPAKDSANLILSVDAGGFKLRKIYQLSCRSELEL